MKSQRRTGILLSYFNFAVSIAGNLFFTPALILLLGDEQYGLYQVMRSFGGTLLLFNLGVSSIVARSIARCHALGDAGEREKQNTLAIGLLLSVGLSLIVGAAALIVHAYIPIFYHSRYDAAQLVLAQRVFGLFAAASICHILTDAFSGCLLGHEHFAANALVVSFKYALRFGLMFLYIKTSADAAAIARVDLIVGAAALVCLAGYSFFVLHERPRLTSVEKPEIKRLFAFSAAVLMQEAVNQLNTHMDPILLGRFAEATSVVTMYSSALMIYNLYHQFVSMIGGYYLARASALVARHAGGAALTDMVIRPGRFQAAIAVGVITGFALFGQSFISLWIGDRYMDAYGVVLMLMVPALIPLVQSAALSILDARMQRMYRSAVLLFSTLVNALLSIVLIRRIGHIGAALATAFSMLLGHGVLMNRFYARSVGLEISRMLREIFCPVLPAGLMAAALCLPLLLLPRSWAAFLCQCAAFMLIYALLICCCNRRSKRIQSMHTNEPERMNQNGI